MKICSKIMKLNDIDIEPYDTLLLDRDGTINVHIVGDYVRKWDDFEFIPGALEALAKFANHFKYIFIVTNQRGIGKGKYTESDLMDIHNKMCAEIRKEVIFSPFGSTRMVVFSLILVSTKLLARYIVPTSRQSHHRAHRPSPPWQEPDRPSGFATS